MADANFIPEEQQHPALYTLKSESEESKHMKLYWLTLRIDEDCFEEEKQKNKT